MYSPESFVIFTDSGSDHDGRPREERSRSFVFDGEEEQRVYDRNIICDHETVTSDDAPWA